MIGLSKRAIVEGIGSISENWLCFGFNGALPTKESLMPFDPKDDAQLYNNCLAAFEMSSTVRGDHIKFYGTGGIVPYKGVSKYNFGEGHLVTPNTVNSNLDLNLFDRSMLVSGQLGMNKSVQEDDYIEYQFDPCILSSVRIESSNTMVGDIEYHDGNDWILLDSAKPGSIVSYPGAQVEAFGLRVRATASTTWRIDAIELLAETDSGTPTVKQSIDWVVLMPSSASAIGDVAINNYPYIYLAVGGPNAETPMMINSVNPEYGQEVKLLYFTLGSDLIEF